MDFTYKSYQNLIQLLGTYGYQPCAYHTWQGLDRCVILRHDIDYSLDKAVELARIEHELGVASTYFALLSSDFYNPASKSCTEKLHTIQDLGHEVGLHFDEKAYPESTPTETVAHILRERDILSAILGTPIATVSMHRPSKATLDADLEIPGMVNSYAHTFFHHFKYLSDSRRRWREPVLDIIRAGGYDRLHILTHAFWYHKQEEPMACSVGNFIRGANAERYEQMTDNITDLPSIIQKEDCT